MKELTVPADLQMLDEVIAFIDRELEEYGCLLKQKMQIDIAVEEIYVNIARYAYHPETGDATIRCMVEENPIRVSIQFQDGGKPYNPLEKPDPDTTLSASERETGGLGIYMVKKSMDDISYEYKDRKNILTIKKSI